MMNTNENCKRLREYLEANILANQHLLPEFVQDDIVPAAGLAEGEHGLTAFRDNLRAHEGLSCSFEVLDMIGDGPLVAARIRVSGTHDGEFLGHPASGRHFSFEEAIFVKFRDRKIAQIWAYADKTPLFEQLGIELSNTTAKRP